MRRFLKWSFTATAAVSLLLCAAAFVLWVRSYWVWEDLYIFQPPSYACRRALPFPFTVRSSAGGLCIGLLRPHGPVPPQEVQREARDFPPWSFERIKTQPIYPRSVGPSQTPSSPGWTESLGVSWARWPSTTEFVTYDALLITFPYWMAALAAAILPAVWTIRQRRQRRRRSFGLCHVCGYDMRATPERCPECGAVPVAKGPLASI